MKIKAFTLMEVTVAMLISAICITICYSAYGIIASYYTAFQQKNDKTAAIMELQHVLEKDFLRGRIVLNTDSGLTVQLDSAIVLYTFRHDRILREFQGIHTDTFKVSAEQPFFSFDNKPITQPDTIDQVSFRAKLDKNQVTTVLVTKLYSAENLFH